jgi:hypothetical protein
MWIAPAHAGVIVVIEKNTTLPEAGPGRSACNQWRLCA